MRGRSSENTNGTVTTVQYMYECVVLNSVIAPHQVSTESRRRILSQHNQLLICTQQILVHLIILYSYSQYLQKKLLTLLILPTSTHLSTKYLPIYFIYTTLYNDYLEVMESINVLTSYMQHVKSLSSIYGYSVLVMATSEKNADNTSNKYISIICAPSCGSCGACYKTDSYMATYTQGDMMTYCNLLVYLRMRFSDERNNQIYRIQLWTIFIQNYI